MILFGASGHGKVILDILQLNGKNVEVVYDDAPKLKEIFSVPVAKNNIEEAEGLEAIIAIGNNLIRKKIAERFNFKYQKALHPLSVVAKSSKVCEGTVVMAKAVVNADAKIGKHCIINTGAVVEHDCVLEDYVHISPNAALAGNVVVGEGTHVGVGASVIQGVKIGKWATIGAGAVVIKDVPDGATVVGNPARVIRIQNIE
ncbi:acetyltransferase [Riemerella anatipestifer]|uniref:acetyltransferase n=1 Tax=Riemerella anatipestifer TaxID=34085 RepID=UPI0021F8C7F4|nr:acetyltransferase [Riemerella anatipestifer]MCW0478042.1 acetyltransferase [Riemerella anatipestifer]